MILHLDMDAFFASVEQLDNPEYRGKPVIVGGAERGVVSAASYEARKFGVRSAMPVFQAKKLCPHGIFVRGSKGRYSEVSRQIMAILQRFSPLVEQASVDEAYLDVSGLERIFGNYEDIAQKIKSAVKEESGLTCSVGIAPVKFLAKIASDQNKPDGITILMPGEAEAFLRALPVNKIPGVGKRTQGTLDTLGVRLVSDVLRYPEDFWKRRLGKAGEVLYARAQGKGSTTVEPYSEPKSESAENTFQKDTLDRVELARWLLKQAERVGASLRKHNLAGRTVTLKVKYADFTQITRSRTLKKPTNVTRTIYETGLALLEELNPQRPLRLIGVGVSQFGGQGGEQLSLFSGNEATDPEKREAKLDTALDSLREKFGQAAVIRGKLFTTKKETD